MPEQGATVIAPDGRKLVFLRVPQLGPLLKQILAAQPTEVTYRWAYHAGHRVHVLFVYWNSGHQVGVAIPEDEGEQVLAFLEGTSDVFLTEAAVDLPESASKEQLEAVIYSTTVPIPRVQFQRQA
jgi:hypothetical protein